MIMPLHTSTLNASPPSNDSIPKRTKWVEYSYVLIGVIFFAYVLTRGFSVGATYDEIMTIEDPVSLPFFDSIFHARPVANNHLLNTILIKVLFNSGCKSLFLARLPNILAFTTYAYFSYKTTSIRLSPVAGLGCFLLLICNPFLLDFFSLARGYGLSLAFMSGALYFAIENTESFSGSTLTGCLTFASLSVLSLLSMLYLWIGLAIAVVSMQVVRKNKNATLRSIFQATTFGVVLLAIIAIPAYRQAKAHAFYYGGTDSFCSDTLLSLVKYSMYRYQDTPSFHLVLSLLLLLLALLIPSAYWCERDFATAKGLSLSITATTCIMIIALHHTAGILYPINRVALFLYPLFIYVFCFHAEAIVKGIRYPLLAVAGLVSLTNFATSANFNKTVLWSFEAHSTEILCLLNEQGEKNQKVVTLGAAPILRQSLGYYIKTGHYPWVSIAQNYEKGNSPTDFDYYALLTEDPSAATQEEYTKHWGSMLDPYDKDILIQYSSENIFVFKNIKNHTR